jgi:outer membrane biosynthesis protein TonB
VTTAALILGGILAVAAVVFVARPFLRDPALSPEGDRLDDPGPLGQRQLALAEERDRALAALKELEFDHRTGKVSDEDYRELVGPLRRAAAQALLALEPRAGRLLLGPVSEQPTVVPEPSPVPHEPPQQPEIPEPYPPPSPPPQPTPVPEPSPVPHEPPQPQAGTEGSDGGVSTLRD